MRPNQTERMRRRKEFEAGQDRLRAHQIKTIIAESDRICIELGHQIQAEEKRARISDPTHFAYPTLAKAARDRRTKIQGSVNALKIELNRLSVEGNQASNQQFVA